MKLINPLLASLFISIFKKTWWGNRDDRSYSMAMAPPMYFLLSSGHDGYPTPSDSPSIGCMILRYYCSPSSHSFKRPIGQHRAAEASAALRRHHPIFPSSSLSLPSSLSLSIIRCFNLSVRTIPVCHWYGSERPELSGKPWLWSLHHIVGFNEGF